MERKNKTLSLGEILSGKELGNSASSEITLTPEEREEAIQLALDKKREIAAYHEQQERRKLLDAEISRPWNSSEMFEYVCWRAANKLGFLLEIDDKNHETIKILTRYFTNDPRFEQMGDGWSLNKGIILAGNVGTGKTTLMQLFNANKKASYKMVDCRELADQYASIGPEILHFNSKKLNVPSSIDSFRQTQIGICFDDLGTENQGKHFGSSANVMEQILLNRYSNNDLPRTFTHITTNLTALEMEEYYGTRVRSRMREMFNLIQLDGEDRRK